MFSSSAKVLELTKKKLFTSSQKEKIKRRSLLQAGIIEKEGVLEDRSLQTILRIRPSSDNEHIIEIDSPTSVLVKPEGKQRVDKYTFSKVLPENSSQRETFNETCKTLLEGILNDHNSCLFTYGASSSGKTYTIMGGEGEQAGLLPRALESLFQTLNGKLYTSFDIRPYGSAYINLVGVSEERKCTAIKNELLYREIEPVSEDFIKRCKRSSLLNAPLALLQGKVPDPLLLTEHVKESDYIVFGSFIEIYNEKIYDLLVAPTKNGRRDELRIRQDARGPFVGGVREIQLNSTTEAYKLLQVGRKNLIVGRTNLNNESSRSHCIFTVKIARKVTSKKWAVSALCFCDLAGSERSKKIGNDSKRLDESKTINKSLMQLGIVIEELRNNQARPGTVAVSFRNSKLTRLMQKYLTGDAKTSIIVAVSQNPQLSEESVNSLKFAASAQTVKTFGMDRTGRLVSSTRLNMTVINEQTMNCKSLDSCKSSQASSNEETMLVRDESYKKWRKCDLIDDLIYYKDRDREQMKTMIKMKNAWKQDELEKNMYKTDLDRQQIHALNEMIQLRSRMQDDHEIEMIKLLDKLKLKSAALRELENNICSLEEYDNLLATQKAYNKLRNSHDILSKENSDMGRQVSTMTCSLSTLKANLDIQTKNLTDREKEIQELRNIVNRGNEDKNFLATKDNKILDLEQELITLRNQNAELLKNGDISLDLSQIGPPTQRSSVIPTRLQNMNSTVDLMSFSGCNIKTPDSSVVKDSRKDDTVELCKQNNSLSNIKDHEIQRLRDHLAEKDEEIKRHRDGLNSASALQIKEAADREADLNDKINKLEIDKEILEKKVERSVLKKKNDRLQTENLQLLEQISVLEEKLENVTDSAPTGNNKDQAEQQRFNLRSRKV